MSTTTTTNDVVVNASQWAAYVAKRDGGTTTDAMKAGGYASTGAASAAIKRVKDAVDAGKNVVVDGDTVNAGNGDTVVTVDRIAIADGILDGAGDFIGMMDRHIRTARDASDRAAKLRADADAADADAAAATARIDRVKEFAVASGFDFDAFDKAVTAASTPPKSDDAPKVDA